MKVSIYQVNLDRDENGIAFESYKELARLQNTMDIDSAVYDKVYEGDVIANDLEDVYRIFNIQKPEGYSGRSMSVSDIVRIEGAENVKSGFYYCDSIGFKDVDFKPELCREEKKETITVVMCEPGKKAYVTDIGNKLEDLQKAVDGYVEAFYPFETEECIVCNEEGKINGSAPCRGITDDEGGLVDIVFGKFFICDCSGENFGSLSPEKQNEYLEKFGSAERFMRIDDRIHITKFEPKETEARHEAAR